ncbi:MAG TPA: dTDP-4-dehydrorhamnose reductase [Bacteroidales bacterium]|nr:dTDP-4-dehydrorhamnose reductase [Bacteroidales bacterium]
MKKILITGSKGQLGSELSAAREAIISGDIYFTDIDEVDLANAKQVQDLIYDIKPDYLINCAAYTAVDRAESDIENAYKVNSKAVKNIADAAPLSPRMKFIHMSTDFVFRGKRNSPYEENADPDPVSVYGKSKRQGELYALTYPLTAVIRTSWLYSEYGGNFVKTILRLAGEKEEIKVVNDQIGTPTWAADLASAIISILNITDEGEEYFVPGIYHYSNSGSCSWYDFAREIKNIKDLDIKIVPVSTAEFPLPAKRPQYSVLNLDKIKKTYRLAIPGWQESLMKCLNRL